MKKWLLALAILGGLILSVRPTWAQTYSPIGVNQLKNDIDAFAEAGAKGYLVWQYSGDRGTGQEFANDKYSFFRNLPTGVKICEALKEKSDQYPDMFIGVNMWDAGEARHSQAKLVDHYSYLKNECGVKVIRSFAYAGGADGVAKNLAAAQATGIQLILAVGDYSNGGGGVPKGAGRSWYASGYTGEYLTFVNAVLAVSKNNSALYGYELANEPHCGGDTAALPDYIAWGERVGNLLRGGSSMVGFGQMASQTATMCDTVGNGHFAQSNAISPISMTSAHYYDTDERTNALAAAAATPPGKIFYIGEAGWGEELDPDDYYLYPIDGLVEKDAERMRQNLINQGYQVQCTTPAYDMKLVEGGEIMQYKSLGLPPLRAALSAEQIYDVSEVQVPIWRGASCSGNGGPITNPFCSLEAYWSFANYQARAGQATLDSDKNEITAAPVYRGLTLQQQCQAKVSLLNTIGTMCEKLEDPSTCALYQEIPGTEYSTRSLREGIQPAGFSCEMMETPDEKLTDTQADIKAALNEVPFNLDKAFRLAFLVTCTELQEFNGVFGFLSAGNTAPKDECRVVAFKIPDIGTNKDTGDMAYTDSLGYTRRLLTTVEQQQKDDQLAADERGRLRAQIPAGQSGAINCGSSNCQEPLTSALVDLIEANGDRCELPKEQLEYEPSSQIGSSGELISSEGTQFADGQDPAADLFVSPTTQQTEPQRGVFNFIADAVIGADGGDKQTKTRSFLIMPVGYELEAIEKGLLALLESKYAESLKEVPDGQEFFKLNNITRTITSSRFVSRFISPEGPKEINAEIGADLQDTEPRYPGAIFGYLTRVLQTALRPKDHPEHDYLVACKTTEDFLLGNCVNPLSGSPEQQQQNEYMNQEVIDTSTCRGLARIGTGTAVEMTGPACTEAQGPAGVVGQPSFVYKNSLEVSQWRNGNDATPLCNENLYKYITCTYGPGDTEDGLRRQGSRPALIAHKVNASGEFDPQGTMTACEYVVQQAKARNVSPRLALAMWGEESGFSSSTTEASGQDYGVISLPTSRASGGIAAQLNSFLNTIRNPNYSNYLGFLLAYSGERDRDQSAPVLFCNNRQFPERLYTYYNYLRP